MEPTVDTTYLDRLDLQNRIINLIEAFGYTLLHPSVNTPGRYYFYYNADGTEFMNSTLALPGERTSQTKRFLFFKWTENQWTWPKTLAGFKIDLKKRTVEVMLYSKHKSLLPQLTALVRSLNDLTEAEKSQITIVKNPMWPIL